MQELLVGAAFEGPDDSRLPELAARLRAVPLVLADAEQHLGAEAEVEFGRAALAALAGREGCFAKTVAAIAVARATKPGLDRLAADADTAVGRYEKWVSAELGRMREGHAAVGRAGMEDLLANVSLVGWLSIEQMLDHAASELQRAQAMAAFEKGRATGVPPRVGMTTIAEQDAAMKRCHKPVPFSLCVLLPALLCNMPRCSSAVLSRSAASGRTRLSVRSSRRRACCLPQIGSAHQV